MRDRQFKVTSTSIPPTSTTPKPRSSPASRLAAMEARAARNKVDDLSVVSRVLKAQYKRQSQASELPDQALAEAETQGKVANDHSQASKLQPQQVQGKEEGFERPLSDDEIQYAREIFANSLNYSDIKITRHHLFSTGASKTIGNTIYLGDKDGGGSSVFAKDGRSLTASGKQLLIHEMTHVWQFQNGGLQYVPDSLVAQFRAQITKGTRGGAYEWREAFNNNIPWKDWNPEQQASAVEEYNVRLQNIKSGSHKKADFLTLSYLKPYIDLVQSGQGAPQSPKLPSLPSLPDIPDPVPKLPVPKLPGILKIPNLY